MDKCSLLLARTFYITMIDCICCLKFLKIVYTRSFDHQNKTQKHSRNPDFQSPKCIYLFNILGNHENKPAQNPRAEITKTLNRLFLKRKTNRNGAVDVPIKLDSVRNIFLKNKMTAASILHSVNENTFNY